MPFLPLPRPDTAWTACASQVRSELLAELKAHVPAEFFAAQTEAEREQVREHLFASLYQLAQAS
jgi:hypothetical protein